MPKNYSIVGIEHRKAEDLVKKLQPGMPAVLVREPNNPFDPLAVAVWVDGKHVGYIPKKQNQALAQFIDQQGDAQLALDAASTPSGKSIAATFIRSPNSGFPMVTVD